MTQYKCPACSGYFYSAGKNWPFCPHCGCSNWIELSGADTSPKGGNYSDSYSPVWHFLEIFCGALLVMGIASMVVWAIFIWMGGKI